MTEKMGCTAEKMTFFIFRASIGGYPRQASFWQWMIDKVQRKLDKWKRFNLSRG